MRTLVVLTVAAVSAVAASVGALAADSTSTPVTAPKVVHLDGAASLAQLAKANPNHAARAERIIAAAPELCKPGPEAVTFARFQADRIECDGAFLRTSYPAKQEISFTLDDTRYIALVAVADGAPRVIPAR
jgi:hypothetical protein